MCESDQRQADTKQALSFDCDERARLALCRAHARLNLSRDFELIPLEDFKDSAGTLLRELENAGLISLHARAETQKLAIQ